MSSRLFDRAAVLALCMGIGLWMLSLLGLDPTNVPQLKDFKIFHFPAIRVFAEHPLAEAIADYPAAPFPLFYVLGGLIYGATGAVWVLKAWTMSLGVVLLALVYARVRQHLQSRSAALLWTAAVLISPYFRGQTVYANTDILALVFAFGALYCFGEQAPRLPSGRALAAFALAFGAVYTRQFYVFLPAYVLLRTLLERPLRERVFALLLCAVLSVPIVALVLFWGSITPPRFVEHATTSFVDSVPAAIVLMCLYMAPLAVVTLWKHRAAFLAELRSPVLRVAALPFALLALYLLSRAQGIPDVEGGGMPLHALKALPIGNFMRTLVLALSVLLGGVYLAYIVRQNPAKNSLLLLATMCFFPTRVLYQRYFDPLLPAMSGTTLAARELSGESQQAVALMVVALELVVAVTGMFHYRTVFGSP